MHLEPADHMKCKPCTLQVLANPVGNAVQDNAGLTLHMLQRKKLLLGSAMELDKLLLPLLLLASAARGKAMSIGGPRECLR